MWEVEFTDEFENWWNTLLDSVAVTVNLLESEGPMLPYSSRIRGSRHSHMRELRIQHCGKPYRVLYAFDPRRCAILLIGGSKVGNNRWYEESIPIADDLYDEHLKILKKKGLTDA
jgi:hypothetical protein